MKAKRRARGSGHQGPLPRFQFRPCLPRPPCGYPSACIQSELGANTTNSWAELYCVINLFTTATTIRRSCAATFDPSVRARIVHGQLATRTKVHPDAFTDHWAESCCTPVEQGTIPHRDTIGGTKPPCRAATANLLTDLGPELWRIHPKADSHQAQTTDGCDDLRLVSRIYGLPSPR